MKRQPWAWACVALLLASSADAALTHRYSFNDGTANDSIGSANGTVVGTNGSISGGQLDFGEHGRRITKPRHNGCFFGFTERAYFE